MWNYSLRTYSNICVYVGVKGSGFGDVMRLTTAGGFCNFNIMENAYI